MAIESLAVGEDQVVLAVRGEIDLLSAPPLRAAIDAALAPAPSRLVLDLAGVTFIDSCGLAVLIEATRRVSVAIRAPSAATRRAIEASGLTELFHPGDEP